MLYDLSLFGPKNVEQRILTVESVFCVPELEAEFADLAVAGFVVDFKVYEGRDDFVATSDFGHVPASEVEVNFAIAVVIEGVGGGVVVECWRGLRREGGDGGRTRDNGSSERGSKLHIERVEVMMWIEAKDLK